MRSFERKRVFLILGIGLLMLVLAAVVARGRLTALDEAVESRKAADNTLVGLAKVRFLLDAIQDRGVAAPPAVGKEATPLQPQAAKALRREVAELEAGLERIRALVPSAPVAGKRGEPHAAAPVASDPEQGLGRVHQELEALQAQVADHRQRERLDQLEWLIRRRFAALASGSPESPELAREIPALLDQLEAHESERHNRVHAGARFSEMTRVTILTTFGLSVVLVALLVAGLVRWEVRRRAWTTRRVVDLIHRQRELVQQLDTVGKADRLTGLPNRSAFVDLLEQRIRWASDGGRGLVVAVADVNRLEHVNAMFGFDGGDDALAQLAVRLRTVVGEGDIAARLGGGEFAVVHACGAGGVDAGMVAEKIQRVLAGEIRIGGQELVLTVNVGYALYPVHGSDARTLLGNAEMALSQARAVGRNVTQSFDETRAQGVADRFVLERRLCTAMKNGEYAVHYQPYFGLESREILGAEALLKWRRGPEGIVAASRFIPVLEETGMILDVGRWVLQTSCGQIHDWEPRVRLGSVSVNLSVVQFRDRRLAGMVAETIGAYKLDPKSLTLEVTESTCLRDVDFAVKTLRSLKDLGVNISIDDFGTGYSSLSYLKKLPADNIKIDISFVRDVTNDQDAASIITAITTLARTLKLKTIAEGVETEEQRKILHLLRCDMGQGYLFSPAVPAPELEAMLFRDPALAAPVARA